jgi:hypothetical protein
MTILGEKEGVGVLEVSRAPMPGTKYECVIVELWQGDREDIAVGVDQYLVVFDADNVPDELLISNRGYSGWEIKREQRDSVVFFQIIKEVKAADKDAIAHAKSDEQLLDPENRRYSYGANARRGEQYEQFLAAIDALGENYEDQEAWAAVEAYRSVFATLHEK